MRSLVVDLISQERTVRAACAGCRSHLILISEGVSKVPFNPLFCSLVALQWYIYIYIYILFIKRRTYVAILHRYLATSNVDHVG